MIFWVEAAHHIGMGHLMESLSLAEEMRSCGTIVHFVLNPYPAGQDILSAHEIPFTVASIEHGVDTLNAITSGTSERIVVINQRAVEIHHLNKLHKGGWKIVVIDQLGRKAVLCDILINWSMIPEWLEYDFPFESPVCCFGPKYALLREEFKKLHECNKVFSHSKKKILVTMGGVDRTGATLRVVDALSQVDRDIQKETVIGNGFVHMEKLELKKKYLNDSFTFAHGVKDLGERMFHSDLVVSAGGFTLYEMACVGAPGIVLWEDPHEEILGRYFEAEGIVRTVGSGMRTRKDRIASSVEGLLASRSERSRMSRLGKALVDGEGHRRIRDRLMALIA